MIGLTPWVRRLLAVNVAVHLLGFLPGMGRFLDTFVLFPSSVLERPWSLVTYAFLHAGFWHILFNMIGLVFFGPRLEERFGSKRFVTLYFIGAVGGALFHLLAPLFGTGPPAPVIGASGAIYGVLISFAMIWPNQRIYLWMVIPVQAWLLATILVVGALYAGVFTEGGNVAHLAHLGGAVCAGLYLRGVKRSQSKVVKRFKETAQATPSNLVQARAAVAAWSKIDLDSLHSINREEVERLMGKVKQSGPGALTFSERATLDRMAKRTQAGT